MTAKQWAEEASRTHRQAMRLPGGLPQDAHTQLEIAQYCATMAVYERLSELVGDPKILRKLSTENGRAA